MNALQKQKASQSKLIVQANGYNFPEKIKPGIVLPKLQENETKISRNPRSLSPMFEHRRIKTSQENILKTSLQIFPTNMDNSKNQFSNRSIEEYPIKRVKHPMKSAQLNRNLYSGQKHRKSSEYNPYAQRSVNLSSGNRGSISTPNIPPSQAKILAFTPLQYSQYQLFQQNRIAQTPPSSSLPQLNLRPPSKSMGNVNTSSSKNVNFSVSVSQYYSQDGDAMTESQQQQQMQFSSTSQANPTTPEMHKKFSQKSTMAAKHLQPIFEEKDNNPSEMMKGKSYNINQEQQTSYNITSSPQVAKILIPLSTQSSQQTQAQLTQGAPYFFSNQSRKYLVRNSQKKPKTQVEGGFQDKNEKLDPKLLENYTNLVMEREIQQQNFKSSIQRFKEDKQQLIEEREALKNKIKQMENESVFEQLQQERQAFHNQVSTLMNLQYDELFMQLDVLCERLVKYSRINLQENQQNEIENQFKSMKRLIESVREQYANNSSKNNNNNIKGFQNSLYPPIRFYPPHLIRFDHSQRLGKGGFCAVFKTQVGQQEMAQKVFEYDLDECSSIMSETLEGIFNEVKILLKVNTFSCSAFVRFYGISFDIRRNEMSGRDQFVFAIFMELIGTYDKNRFLTCDLKKYINQQRTKPAYTKKYLELSLQIAEAIETLYNNNIIHSDLKPQNIMIDENQNIKIIDFGTSKFNSKPYTYDTNLLGFTPRYCPLEHFDMERLTPTTDVWSFGCLLFEMVTGNEPWKGIKNLQDVRKALENKQSLWLHYQSQISHQETSHINTEIIELIEKCTSYENRPHPCVVAEKINEILLQYN